MTYFQFFYLQSCFDAGGYTRESHFIGVKCPQHACLICDGKASNRGGLLFRCTDCPSTVCESCLPESFEAVDRNDVVAVLGFLSGSIEYIRCSACLGKPPNALYRLMLENESESQQDGRQKGRVTTSVSEAGNGGLFAANRHSCDSKKAVKMVSRYGVSASMIVNSDDELDIPLASLKSVPPLDSDQPGPPYGLDCEGASVPAEIRKRRLEADLSPDKGRPSRHCAIVGADARYARQLQESKMQGVGADAGVQSRSPKYPKIPHPASGQPQRILTGMDDIELRELACSSAQTPTTLKRPNQMVDADELDVQPSSLQFPSNLSSDEIVDRIEISSD